VVFTLPSELNGYALSAPKVLYETLFDATWDTMQTFGKNKGLKMGLIAVLHTWGQNLSLHPHLHCIVPGGGTNSAGEWQNLRSDGKYLFCVKALAKVFRAKFLSRFLKHQAMESKLRNDLYGKPWVVYAKKPFGTPKSVVEYLGRYTHKIAISNHRIKNIDEHTASFEYKDYKAYGQKKLMKLSHQEFIRRFALHILPRGFVKMRHYGILSSTWKRSKLKKLQADLHLKPIEGKSKGTKLKTCPCCKKGKLITVSTFGSRGPPAIYMGVGQTSSPCNS
jgi:hypothetical protein